jgi:trimeric autotransporter adhesin
MRSHVWFVALAALSVVFAQGVLGQTPVLVAGGDFTTAGGISANYIAQWNGTTWSALESGLGGVVRALVVYEELLVAGGDFISAWNGDLSVPASRIAS